MPEIRVGLLAYGAIGHEHNQAVQATPGLTLTAVCDTNPERIDAARELAPDLTGFTDADEMLDSGLLDLVVVSTPPNSHHDWAMKALERDLHVVLEKPMALTADECDAALAFAAEKGKTLVVYQDRRFDRDFITMRRLIREGSIGDVFQYDSFVGGYSVPAITGTPMPTYPAVRSSTGVALPRSSLEHLRCADRARVRHEPQAQVVARDERRSCGSDCHLQRRPPGHIRALRSRRRTQAQVLRPRHRGRDCR